MNKPLALPNTRIRYSRAEAAAALSISPRKLDRLREAGAIVARVDGGRIYFDHDELVSYAQAQPVEGAARAST